MKIGIILHPFNEQCPAGLGRFIYELTKELLKYDKSNDYIIYTKNRSSSPIDLVGSNWKIISFNYRFLWLDRTLKNGERADVYIFNTPILPLLFRLPSSIVFSMDYAYRHFPSHTFVGRSREFLLFLYQKLSLRRAHTVIAISEATKQETVRIGNVPSEKVQVVYPGYNNICGLDESTMKIPTKYFLFVGVVKERKNVFNVVRAYHIFCKKYPDYKLLIVGKAEGDYYEAIKSYVQTNRIANDVIFFGHVTDNELSFLYNHAFALVFPSFIEGFGFPVLEAMQCGLPVVTSDRSALAETASEAALLVDPYSVGAIQSGMEGLVSHPERRALLIRAGKRRAEMFSWERCARSVLDVVHKI